MINIEACNSLLTRLHDDISKLKPIDFASSITQKRFVDKFQAPDSSHIRELKDKAWSDWISFDESLPDPRFCGLWYPDLYKVRHELHQLLRKFKLRDGDLEFTPGETFSPSKGQVSVEAKLSRPWTVSHDAFPAFAGLVYRTHALKASARKKFRRYSRAENRTLWAHFKGKPFDVFSYKLEQVCIFTHGSRFSTVPKNNEKRRPINIEPFGNVLLQRQVGLGLRRVLSQLGNDLDSGQSVHRNRISSKIATLDLKNASDSISIALCKFLLPPSFFRLLMNYRSYGIYHDDCVYITRKISAMGNGFTFELMTLILLTICRLYDPEASVYGDDIICTNDAAKHIVKCVEAAHFVVNEDKSFIDAPQRESCGAYYSDEIGYITCFDIKWCENPSDVIQTLNKFYRIATSSNPLAPKFHAFWYQLSYLVPRLYWGPDLPDPSLEVFDNPKLQSWVIDPFFEDRKVAQDRETARSQSLAQQFQTSVKRRFIYVYQPKLRSPLRRSLTSRQYAKYFMYLYGGLVTKDHLRGKGKWVKKSIHFSASGGVWYPS
jgi:hypothetical protein